MNTSQIRPELGDLRVLRAELKSELHGAAQRKGWFTYIAFDCDQMRCLALRSPYDEKIHWRHRSGIFGTLAICVCSSPSLKTWGVVCFLVKERKAAIRTRLQRNAGV